MRDHERFVLLKSVDNHWIDHIDALDQLKQGIGLRAIGQQNPLTAYQIEGFGMFEEMISSIKRETVKFIYGATLEVRTERKEVAVVTNESNAVEGPVRKKKVGRNEPCPCGSGLKYKKCCGRDE